MPPDIPKTQVIIPAAGTGERLQAGVIKALVPLDGRPLLIHALTVLDRCLAIDSIIMVGPADSLTELEACLNKYQLSKICRIVPGGATRADSVRNGMQALDADTAYVLIHDAARPLIDQALVERTLTAAYQHQAAIAAVPVKPTIKQVDLETMTVTATPDRRQLWEAQTPQVFARGLLEEAQQNVNQAVTDEAMLVEKMGHNVAVVEGSYRNLKITTAEDLICAAALLNAGSAG